jgi:aldehyde:ferredoxin oxidoreductase
MINLGPKCGLDNLAQIIQLDNLCGRLGIDSTSAATVIAFAMDLFERGILTPADTQGLELTWGHAETMQTLIQQMAQGNGIGGLLAQGVKRAAQTIGKDADQYAAHVKGLELAAYHPGSIMGTALGYAISSRGGDYSNVYSSLEHRWSEERANREIGSRTAVDIRAFTGKGKLIKRAVLVNIVLDSLGLCKVPVLSMINTFDLKSEAALAGALMGVPITAKMLFSAGKRIASMERSFNLRQKSDMEADMLPELAFNQPDSNLSQATLNVMIHEFYEAMGWDQNGIPDPDGLRNKGE